MDTVNHTLPDDIEELKMIISCQREEIGILEEYKQKYEKLENKFNYLQKLFFGKKSEKLSPEDEHQGRLFDEAETHGSLQHDSDESPEKEKNTANTDDVTTVKGYSRKKAGRKPIPDTIPRIEDVHDLPEDEKGCSFCGETRPRIGQETSEELEYIPARVFVRKHVYPKYGPCTCEKFILEEQTEVISAPAKKRMLPGSIVSEGLLAYIITSKFCDALPFYRLSKMFGRIDVDISRATMCNWQLNIYEKLEPFFEVMKETLKSGEFIRMDETTVQVLHEKNRSPDSKSYMWIAIGYPIRGRPLVLYEYHPTRSGMVPMKFLEGFKGHLQTDGYAAYNLPVVEYGLVHVGCLAHARREFHKAHNPKIKNSRAYKVLKIIQRIYKIESDLRENKLPDDVFVEKRKNAVTPVLDELHRFLTQTKEIVAPSSLTGEAIKYTLNQWNKIIRYLDLACMTPDNNEIERSIKSFVIGRKNWLFSNTPRGAHASAGMYSLIESAKANKLDPYAYIRFLLSRFPPVKDDRKELRKLLPCFLSPEQIKIFD